MKDLLGLLLDKIEYDFCEDDEDIQGNWDVKRDGSMVRISFDPFPESPNSRAHMVYRIERVL